MIPKIPTSLLASLATTGTPPYNSIPFWTPKQLELSGLMDKTEVTIQEFLKVEPYPAPPAPGTNDPNLSFQERYILQHPASLTTGAKETFFKHYYAPIIQNGSMDLAWEFVDLYENENPTEYPDYAHRAYSIGISEARSYFMKNAVVTSDNFLRFWDFFNTHINSFLSDALNFFINSKSKQDLVYSEVSKYEIADIVLPLYEAKGGGTDLRTILNTAKAGNTSTENMKLYSDYINDNSNWSQTSTSMISILVYQIASQRQVLSSLGYDYIYVNRAVQAVEFETNYTLKSQYFEALNQYVKDLFV